MQIHQASPTPLSRHNNTTAAGGIRLFFGGRKEERIRVGAEYEFEFHTDADVPDRLYDPAGKYGSHEFEKHYYPRMVDFDSAEEFACACWLDRQTKVKFWVRNLVRKNGMSFFPQKANGRFYPDFLCKLDDGRILAVEYKGQNGWTTRRMPARSVGFGRS